MFQASTAVLTAAMRTRMTGVSWRPGCPVTLGQLRLLRLSYWGFDHAVHQGELIVNASAAASLTEAFRQLFAARFPIRQMRVVDDFGGDDERSMLADNTSAFNCLVRAPAPGRSTLMAWRSTSTRSRTRRSPTARPTRLPLRPGRDRSRPSPAIIRDGDAAWRAFRDIGWTWGGDWRSPKDYMHFSANGL